jgi:hypothetical protein
MAENFVSSEARCSLRTDGRTDEYEEAIVFANAPKNKRQAVDDMLINGVRNGLINRAGGPC